MRKDIVISVLAAAVAVQSVQLSVREEIGIFIGIMVLSFFFCLFLEEMGEKLQKKLKRMRKIERKVKKLRRMKITKGA